MNEFENISTISSVSVLIYGLLLHKYQFYAVKTYVLTDKKPCFDMTFFMLLQTCMGFYRPAKLYSFQNYFS